MSIYPDKKNGKLTGRFCVEVQHEGKRLRGRKDTYKEAQALEAEFERMFKAGIAQVAKRKFSKDHSKPHTLSEAVSSASGKVWAGLASEADNLNKLSTFLSVIGDRDLDSITAEHVDDLASHLLSSGRSEATLNRYMSAISVFLGWCIERGYRSQPVPKMDWREESEGRIRWLTYEEERLMIAHTRDDIPAIIRVAIDTGLRASELLRLDEKGDIAPNWIHLWKTKNGAARSVPISSETYATLSRLLDKGMPSYSHLRYEWDKATNEIGLGHDEDFVFHTCRHTYATRLVEANVNLRVIQRLMGHKRIETTMRYAHVHDAMLTEAAAMARSFHDSRRSVARVIYNTQKCGLAEVREIAKGPLFIDGKDTENCGSNGAGVAELVDAPDLGSDQKYS